MIADYVNLSIGQLRQRYLRRIGLRTTIIEEPKNKDCIFLYTQDNTKRCRIYPVRPNQCRTWPFWASKLTSARTWNEAARKCPGINRGRLYSCEEIERLKKQRKWWTDA
jgi:Fe-S-cluster containining protein